MHTYICVYILYIYSIIKYPSLVNDTLSFTKKIKENVSR